MRVALIGQPNCGKSTLFNQVAGYKAETGNFSGTTVAYTESRVRVAGEVIELVDLPGVYTLEGGSLAELETARYLDSRKVDVVINVVDSTQLATALELSLELLPLNKPMILALNMMDEAARLGLQIDGEGLARELKVPVLPLIASKGRGVKRLFLKALNLGRNAESEKPSNPNRHLNHDTLRPVTLIEHLPRPALAHSSGEHDGANLPGSHLFWKRVPESAGLELHQRDGDSSFLAIAQNGLEWSDPVNDTTQQDASIRHARAIKLALQFVTQGERRITWRDQLDDVLLHPAWGYAILLFVLFLFFEAVYGIGKVIEPPLLALFDAITKGLLLPLERQTLIFEILVGVLQGIAAGVAIVLPYLMPFLLGLGVLEDIGYLPRVAFLMDALMHRIGLHGKAIVPFILGYGCNVPAVMSTRTLEEPRDRYLAAALATLVPCAARLAVVFGLVAYYLGPATAFALYLFNLLIIAMTGRILSRLMPEDTPGFILEMPPYRVPTFKNVVSKAWFRIREFVVEAWPILIAGSAILAALNYFNLALIFNWLVRPITWMMGLPPEVGVPLIFGVLRKELSLVMLSQALGTLDFSAALSNAQMVIYATFVMFYLPCLATLSVLRRELGMRAMLAISALTVVVALIAALVVRGVLRAW